MRQPTGVGRSVAAPRAVSAAGETPPVPEAAGDRGGVPSVAARCKPKTEALYRLVADNPFVIPGKLRGKAMRNLNDPWDIVCERAGLEDMRLHDCRHSYASRALALGESLPMIGRLLGHTQVRTFGANSLISGRFFSLILRPGK